MSTTTVLGVAHEKRPVELARLHNGHGWSPSIWRRLLKAEYGFNDYLFAREGSGLLDRLWQSIEERPEWQQAPLVLTFDTGVVPWQAYEEVAEHLDEFEARLPAPDGHVNHVPAVAELLRTKPEAPAVGVWATTVSENPFDPWDYDADDFGSGLPFAPGGVYVLERHRHLIPQLVAIGAV